MNKFKTIFMDNTFEYDNFGFEGMILKSDKDLFTKCEITQPSMEEIMVHTER